MAQEMSMSLGPFFVFLVIRCCIRHLCLLFFRPCRPPPPFWSCRVVVCPHPRPCCRLVIVALVVIFLIFIPWSPSLSSSVSSVPSLSMSVSSRPVFLCRGALPTFAVPVARYHPASSCSRWWGTGGCHRRLCLTVHPWPCPVVPVVGHRPVLLLT